MHHVSTTRAHGRKVANVQRSIMILNVTAAAATTHVGVNRLLASVMTASMMEPSLIELVGSNLTKCILVFSCTSAKVATVALVDWIACTSRSPLLSQFSFGNCFRYRIVVIVASIIYCTWEHGIITTGIEKLCGHHHLLLLRVVCIWCLSLIHQVEKMSLIGCSILVADATCCPNSIVTNTGCCSAKCT